MAVDSKASGIVLYAKKRGPTSFNSLSTIKKSLQTKKVGHTGTLDSFADGLLVVMVGSLTRLASHVTAFDKKYEAIIAFGKETDTLDPYGEVTNTTDLPLINDFKEVFKKYVGCIEQLPPQYSAIHINGKRASDIARSGKIIEMPSRSVQVFSSCIEDIVEYDGRVAYAKVCFHVSKGTYIRSLARDIANQASSCAHLIALRRTSVGSFLLEDAVGYNELCEFSIHNAIEHLHALENTSVKDNHDIEIRDGLQYMTKTLAVECGMHVAQLKSEFEFHFFNGKPLKKSMFSFDALLESHYAVFNESNNFIGVIQFQDSKLTYGYVIPQT